MIIYLKVLINIFCSQVLVLLYAGLQNKMERKKTDYRLFLLMMILVCFNLIVDTIRLLFALHTGLPERFVFYNTTLLFYSVNPLISMLYAVYVELLALPSHGRKRYFFLPYIIPATFVLLLGLTELVTGWILGYDRYDFFLKGIFFHISMVVFYGYLAWALVVAYMRRRKINPRVLHGIITFPVPMGFCGVLQLFLPEYPILLPSIVLSLIVLSSNIQKRQLTYDYLTGAYNRKRLDEYLEILIQDSRNGKGRFCALLADVNKFKHINDTYGHVAGDEALIKVVEILQAGIRFDDFLARYAGDEFVILFPNTDAAELNRITTRIHDKFRAYSTATDTYELSISIGESEFDPSFKGDAEDFITQLDTLMYEQKKQHKKK